jgi:tripartite-type tricarboxylate transporter receptor subunit TctC
VTIRFVASFSTAALAATLAIFSAHAEADTYPSKPIRFVVAFPPGGGTDIIARSIAQKLSERLAQQVVVDNRPGAGGNIGTDIVAKSAPDGYTMLMGSAGPLAINASLFASMPFDPVRDLAPVTLAASTPNVLVVHPSLKVATVKELIALARAKPGAINFASSGHGTPAHLAGELFGSMAGVKLVHVPYKGAAPALADLLGGQVQIMFSTMPPALPHVRDGKLRALAVTSTKRSPAMPELPTVDEAGAESGLRGFEANTWHGVVLPAGAQAAIVARLNREIVAILHMPDVVERLSNQGAEPVGSTPEEFAAYIKSETVKWAKVVRESGAKAE